MRSPASFHHNQHVSPLSFALCPTKKLHIKLNYCQPQNFDCFIGYLSTSYLRQWLRVFCMKGLEISTGDWPLTHSLAIVITRRLSRHWKRIWASFIHLYPYSIWVFYQCSSWCNLLFITYRNGEIMAVSVDVAPSSSSSWGSKTPKLRISVKTSGLKVWDHAWSSGRNWGHPLLWYYPCVLLKLYLYNFRSWCCFGRQQILNKL
jgi:hypothetical protein